ncbi:transcriptional regulator [Bacillus sp. OxB-1]|uniref:hypothetical protein n=1 Tax=Bacillus sp. (strain OxB-1) TaxID=98228 RepID=UPI00058239B9|nr:hypothetical protein [Bacillus sp. OxB-1]BAQ10608.1 transcriptional regulator [Bacillus sp. OxB-1]
MKSILMTTLFIVIVIYNIRKNREILKQFTKLQIIGVGISYLIAIFLAFILIYYGGNWLAGQISNIILKYVVFIVIVLIALYLCVGILNKVLQKITNGVLPRN